MKIPQLKPKMLAGAAILLLIILVARDSFCVVQPNERGVLVVLGTVQEAVLEPGVHTKLPFLAQVRKFRIEPKSYEVTFTVGTDGAITKDMQTVGTTVSVRWMYDTSRIMDIVKVYRDDRVITDAMRDNVKASVKETTGHYSIYELVEQQNKITGEVAKAVLERMASYPIQISQTTITNWDWSEDFDKQIKETANRTQQVRQAEQEANIAEAKAQVKVREANANLEAEKLNAEAVRVKAQAEADAKKLEGEGIASYNRSIAQNQALEIRLKELEIELEKAKRWDGRQVPEAAYVVPGTGAVVPLTTKQ